MKALREHGIIARMMIVALLAHWALSIKVLNQQGIDLGRAHIFTQLNEALPRIQQEVCKSLPGRLLFRPSGCCCSQMTL